MKIAMLQISGLFYTPGADEVKWDGIISLNGQPQGAVLTPRSVAASLTKEEMACLDGIIQRIQGKWPDRIKPREEPAPVVEAEGEVEVIEP